MQRSAVFDNTLELQSRVSFINLYSLQLERGGCKITLQKESAYMPAYPFWMAERGSLEVLTLIMMTVKRKKNAASAKQTRYTATNPTNAVQSTRESFTSNPTTWTLSHRPGICDTRTQAIHNKLYLWA